MSKGSNGTNRKRFAKKELGQNFLADATIIDRIVNALDLSTSDNVIEIGPGRGALTERLVATGANIIAIELDRDLVEMLREKFSRFANLRILEADATEVDFSPLIAANPQSKVVANLPYYISTAILQKLSEQRELFSSLVLMFQREVVDRITAEPGNSDRGFLTVLVESAFHVTKLFDVPPTAFRPQPRVWSSVVRLTPKENVISHPEQFRRLLSAAFAQKRKTILNNLKTFSREALTALKIAEIDAGRRAETLTLDEWLRLADSITQD